MSYKIHKIYITNKIIYVNGLYENILRIQSFSILSIQYAYHWIHSNLLPLFWEVAATPAASREMQCFGHSQR